MKRLPFRLLGSHAEPMRRSFVLHFFAILLALVCLLGAGNLSAADGMKGMLLEDLQIDGGILDFVKEKNAVVIRNYAVLTIGNTKIQARNMVYHYDTKEVFAEGDVVFDDPSGSSFYCDQLFFNTTEWRGIAQNVRIKAERAEVKLETQPFIEGGSGKSVIGASSSTGRNWANNVQSGGGIFDGEVKRMTVSAKSVRSINQDHQEGIGVTVSPSMFAEKHWGIHSNAVNFRKGQKIESWHNVLKIGRVPVFYFPYIIKDLKYDWPWMRVGGGYSSDWGAHVYTKFGFDTDPDPKAMFRLDNLFFNIDWREERGWATGVDVEYETGHRNSRGFLNTYFLNESNISRHDDMKRAIDRNDTRVYRSEPAWEPDLYREDERWGIDWWHRQEFTDNWDLRMEAHKYSDRDFLREYNEWAFKEDKEPETSLDLRFMNDHLVAELVAVKRLNQWQNQSEYLPELRLTIPSWRLGRLPLYLESDTRVGYVNRRFDDAFDKYNVDNDAFNKVRDGDDYDLFARLHNQTLLKAPIHLGNFAVLTPYVGGRVTYYGEQYGDLGNDHDQDDLNSALLWGAELSSRFYGRFTDWRHVVEPLIGFYGGEDPVIERDQLYPIDEIDAYDEQHYFTFDLRQRLQKRTGPNSYRDYAGLDLKLRYYPRGNEADLNNFRRHTTELEVDFNLYPTESLSFWTNALVDLQDGTVNRLYAGADWKFHRRVRLWAQHAYYRGHYWRYPTSVSSESTTVALRTLLWDEDSKYAAEVSFTYDWPDNAESFNGFSEEKFTLYRDLDTFELGVSYVHDRKNDDHGVFFSLTPKGFIGFDRPFSATDKASRMIEKSRYDSSGRGGAVKQTSRFGDNAGAEPKAEKVGIDDGKDKEAREE